MSRTLEQLEVENERLTLAVENLHAILNLSPVADSYETRLAALHAYRDRPKVAPEPETP